MHDELHLQHSPGEHVNDTQHIASASDIPVTIAPAASHHCNTCKRGVGACQETHQSLVTICQSKKSDTAFLTYYTVKYTATARQLLQALLYTVHTLPVLHSQQLPLCSAYMHKEHNTATLLISTLHSSCMLSWIQKAA
jgi:hypothetical protein